MKPTRAAQIRKEEASKRRSAAERFRRYLQDLRRRQRMQDERDRRRKWLLFLLLCALESKPVQMFFPSPDTAPPPTTPKRSAARKSEKKIADDDPRTDDERRYLSDYSARYGEEELEVYDGLTWNDIIALNRIHRPHLFPAFKPIPGMPKQYADEPVNVWTLLDHMDSDYHRPDAIKALKLIVDSSAHDWIEACATEIGDLSYKDLRRQCKRRTPAMTLHEFPRAAIRWRDEQRREAEEKKRSAKEAPDNGSKPPGFD